MLQIILGSQSPRRKEIFQLFNFPFQQRSSNFNEEAVPFKKCPLEYVSILSKGKADALAPLYPNAVIITADTIVYRENTVYEKPKDQEDAFRILSELSGQWHSVYTSVTLKYDDEEYQQTEETRVLFNTLSESQIHTYLQLMHWVDKSGGYGVQTGAGLLVNKIDGCYFNVMGLPVNVLKELLFKVGIDLWHHLKP